MIVALFRGIGRIDEALHRRLGPAYNVVITLGLIAEIARRLHELSEHIGAGLLRPVLAIGLFALLLLHQLAELGEHVERRLGAPVDR